MERVVDHIVTDITNYNSCYQSILVIYVNGRSYYGLYQEEINWVTTDYWENQSPSVLGEGVMDSVNEEMIGKNKWMIRKPVIFAVEEPPMQEVLKE